MYDTVPASQHSETVIINKQYYKPCDTPHYRCETNNNLTLLLQAAGARWLWWVTVPAALVRMNVMGMVTVRLHSNAAKTTAADWCAGSHFTTVSDKGCPLCVTDMTSYILLEHICVV